MFFDFSLFVFRFSFFVIRFSLFGFRFSLFVILFSIFVFCFSFFDIRNRAKYRILTFKILFSHSKSGRISYVAPVVVKKMSYSGCVTLLPGYGHPFQTQTITFACIVSVIIETLLPTKSQSVSVLSRCKTDFCVIVEVFCHQS